MNYDFYDDMISMIFAVQGKERKPPRTGKNKREKKNAKDRTKHVQVTAKDTKGNMLIKNRRIKLPLRNAQGRPASGEGKKKNTKDRTKHVQVTAKDTKGNMLIKNRRIKLPQRNAQGRP